ncbi:MAG: PHP domain-containing protein [Candidatus Tectomicrobia bacterium]|nr:PHP domain-containing protein [Candidatus Tectomicrobia bacterium]
MIIDLHVHTNVHSYDSNLHPVELIQEAKRIGLDGVCITEHNKSWSADAIRALAEEFRFTVLRGIEVTTEVGHILVFGLDEYVSGIHRVETLRRIVDQAGGVMIIPHPFRRSPYGNNGAPQISTIEEGCRLPVLQLVDAMEVINGATTEKDNLFAQEVSSRLKIKGTGGSDAHSLLGIGSGVTIFERVISTEEDLIQEIKNGRFQAGNLQTIAQLKGM